MRRQINIELIDRIRKSKEGNQLLNGIIIVLTFIFYPIISVVGITIMIFVVIFAFF